VAADTTHDKTEQATPRRREESRTKGQIPVSAELNSGFHLLVASTLLWLTGGHIGRAILSMLREWLPAIANTDGSTGQLRQWASLLAVDIFTVCGVVIGALFASGVLVGLLQTGFNVSLESIRLDWSKIDPIAGFGRLFSLRSVMKGTAAVLKLSTAAGIVSWILVSRFDSIASSSLLTLGGTLALGWSIGVHLMLAVAAALVVIGGFDYLFQRWKHDQDMMMSKQEIKDENKQMEGDPHLKARIRKLQRETAQRKMMHDVPGATVVITNPTHLSIALKYDGETMDAPRVVAKGAGAVALRMRTIAEENGVPIVEKQPLARALFAMAEIGDDIPNELFQAVAEILIYVYSLKKAA
jgi:flagellar biosynthetic protein FlhB